jgi:alpha-glucosidase
VDTAGANVPPITTSQTPPPVTTPPVTAPPESFFAQVRERDREAARAFYKKYIDIKGLAVVASAEVADAALQRDYDIVTHMLAGRPDIIKSMVDAGTHLIIIGKDQLYTDMPEYRNTPNPAYQNERVRGTGGIPVTSFGEENLLCLPTDRYDTESIAVHEFCHTIDAALGRIDPTWRQRLQKTYRDAISKGLWKNTYAGSNAAEYWAETCQMYFDCNRADNWNHGPIARREQLKIYDPEEYELIKTTFNLSPEQDWRYHWLQKLPNVAPPPPAYKIDPYYTKFSWASEFHVLGRRASDEAMLKANDTIARMFAYRHDILKALINDGVKLVVLGRNERLADLPQLKNTTDTNVDLTLRFLDYTPATKLLVVPEENVLGNPSDDFVGPCLIIREFAKATCAVCGTRPVDTNWDNRGRDVQQYELRVKRLDVEFDEKLKQICDAAMSKGMWKNTPAVQDRVAYWAEGVLAYFDANNPTGAPFKDTDRNGDFTASPHPITTRELLKAYDPDLWALVNETMAYDGHVDWRYKP